VITNFISTISGGNKHVGFFFFTDWINETLSAAVHLHSGWYPIIPNGCRDIRFLANHICMYQQKEKSRQT
jgi:hypothetical protein